MTPAELKAWRAERELSQAQAATLTGVPQRTWENWEQQGKRSGRRPPRHIALILAEADRRLAAAI